MTLFTALFWIHFLFFCEVLSESPGVPSGVLLGNQHGNNDNTACTRPYFPVGDYCLLIDNIMRGSWKRMREVCQSLDGDLVDMKDANILYDISNYIKDHGMDDISYWVGSNDQYTEGNWVWSMETSTQVKMGAPLWGGLYERQPDGGTDQNCGALEIRDFYYMHDDTCDDSMYGVICQASSNARKSRPITPMPSYECPPPYEKIDSGCFQVFMEQDYSWYEASSQCNSTDHGHIAKIDDANLLGAVYDYLKERENTIPLWIGGTDEASEDHWIWHDGSPVKRGTPFWHVYREGIQEPKDGIIDNCLALYDSYSYHFDDENCSKKFGVLCQYDM